MSQIRRNSRLNFSPRAAIWPLTLGPLGYSGARGTCPMCFLRKRPRGSTGHRRESARTPGERFRMPDNARSAAVDGPASIFRGSVPRAESESAARTYMAIYECTVHGKIWQSSTPSDSCSVRFRIVPSAVVEFWGIGYWISRNRIIYRTMATVLGRVIVYGGKGALGSVCISQFKAQNWWVGSIDMKPNEQADANVLVNPDNNWQQQQTEILAQIKDTLKDEKVDGIICVAGGWAGGNAAHKDFIKNSDLMWKQSVWSSTIAASIATQYLKEGGFLSLTGAMAALKETPGMIGYGMAKAAVHQLTKSLAAKDSGLPSNSLVACILPITLDTPMNRKWMPKADTSTWTSLDFVSNLFWKWSQNQDRPTNGSLLQLITKDNKTELTVA